MDDQGSTRYRFDSFSLDRRERRLTRGNDLVPLEPKAFEVLVFLVENAGRLVTKQALVDAVWARAAVTDNSLTRCIHQVRAALDDDAERPRFIETVPGSGYRFIATVDIPAAESAPSRPQLRPSIAIAAATHAAGMSAALGAFLAGLLLAETEYRHEIQVNIEPFKGLLLGLFFMSVGMGIDLAALLKNCQ